MPEQTATKYTGTGSVAATDYKYVKWVGKTKSGLDIVIELPKAICLSNLDWTFADKGEVVADVEFEGVYNDTTLQTSRAEPWIITSPAGITAGAAEIMCGAGAFYIGSSASDAALVGLTRGGGKFNVERTYRAIEADGDPGYVEGRVVEDGGRPKLNLKALQILTNITKLYSGITTTT